MSSKTQDNLKRLENVYPMFTPKKKKRCKSND